MRFTSDDSGAVEYMALNIYRSDEYIEEVLL